MSKSKLREEYESRFGVVDGTLRLYDDKGNKIYDEDSNGYWLKYEYDDNNNQIYYENSEGYWQKYEYDADGNMTYYETSRCYWAKYESDANGNVIYWEDSVDGVIYDKRSCSDKVFIDEQSGKKFKLTEIK